MNAKKLFCLFTVLCIVFCCVGCVRMDMGIELKEDGTAAMSAKISIDESTYEMLLSLSEDPSVESDGDLDLASFIKETINGEIYYSSHETKNFASYEELTDDLKEIEIMDGVKLFEDIKVSFDGKRNYGLEFMVADADSFSTDSTEDLSSFLPDDWLSLTMTIRMPGEIIDTNGELMEDGSVCFVMNDFTENNSYYVHSEIPGLSAAAIVLIIIGCLGLGTGIALIIIQKKRKVVDSYEFLYETNE